MPLVNFRVDVNPPIDEIIRPFKKTYGQYLDRKIGGLSQRVHRIIREEAPVVKGNLRKAIRIKKRGEADYEIIVDPRTKGGKYEHYVRLGTAPHAIFPVKKKALWWPGLPHPIKMANHPGTKPNPYWDRGIERSRGDIDRTEDDIGRDIEKELIE